MRAENKTRPAPPRGEGPEATTAGGARLPRTEGSWSGRRSLEAEIEFQSARAKLALVEEPEPVHIGPEGRYAIRELIGRGAMGAVYLAEDTSLNRPVALKVVSRVSQHPTRLQDRLRREAWALALLDHPNVLQIHNVDQAEGGELFIVMKYVPGLNLREWVEEEQPSRDQRLAALVAAGRGLAAAHAAGLIHRDFKPDNVLIQDPKGEARVLVADFGLAGGEGLRTEASAALVLTEGSAASTAGVFGTPEYMAPEQARGEALDARADQYAFCVTAWELLTGARPQAGELERPRALPRWLHRLLVRGLAERPQRRHPQLADLLDAIEQTPRRRRRLASFGATATLGGVAAFVGALAFSQPTSSEAELPAPSCEARVEAELAAVWGELERARVDAQLRELTGDPKLADATLAILDGAARRWSTAQRSACEDLAHDGRELDRCHDRWLARFDARVERLATLEAEQLPRLDELLAPLRGGALCDPEAAVIDGQIQDWLDAAELAESLADYDEALALAEVAWRRAGDLPSCSRAQRHYNRERAAAAFRLGHIHGERHDGRRALAALEYADDHATACLDDGRRVAVGLRAAKIAAVDLDDQARAEDELDELEPILARVGELPEELALELGLTRGLVELRGGRYEQAEANFTAVADRLDPERWPMLQVELLINRGVVAERRGELDKARRHFEDAQEAAARRLLTTHPPELDLLAYNRGVARVHAKKFDEARALFGEAAVSEHLSVSVIARTALIKLEHDLRSSDPSAPTLARARATARELLPVVQAHPELAPYDRAFALFWAGQFLADAYTDDLAGVAALREALRLFEEHLPRHPDRDRCEISLAWNLLERGELEPARAHYENVSARELDAGAAQLVTQLGEGLAAAESARTAVAR